ncbi:hypothetical protein [Streptomyces sp. NPDC058371]|uniref:hypothetical protein n=1 Tax=Streptomyces sp. NPDC058371 TaxID=3346463 RepID=UPI0036697C01
MLLPPQLYFPQSVNDQVAAEAPYASNTTPRLSNEEDFFYTQDNNGEVTTMTVTPLKGNGSIRHGLRASMVLGIDPAATPPRPRRDSAALEPDAHGGTLSNHSGSVRPARGV